MSLPAKTSKMVAGKKGKSAEDESQPSKEEPGADLAAMFHQGDNQIERRRTDNLFKQLDERQLTDDEQRIIEQRVELQRKLFQEFEKRERQRKVQELLDVCPDLTQETAEHALSLCNWKEEEAAVRYTSDPWFRRRVLGAASTTAVQAAKAAIAAAAAAGAPAGPAPPAPTSRSRRNASGLSFPRPRLVDAAALQQGHVFVGAFRGRLGPTQIAQQAQRLVDMGLITCRNGRGGSKQQQQAASTGAAGSEPSQQASLGAAAATDTQPADSSTSQGATDVPNADVTNAAGAQPQAAAEAQTQAAKASVPTTQASDAPPAASTATAAAAAAAASSSAEAALAALAALPLLPSAYPEPASTVPHITLNPITDPYTTTLNPSMSHPYAHLTHQGPGSQSGLSQGTGPNSGASDNPYAHLTHQLTDLNALIGAQGTGVHSGSAGCDGLTGVPSGGFVPQCDLNVPQCDFDEDVFEWGPSGIVYSQLGGQEVVRVCLEDAQLTALVNKAVNEAAAAPYEDTAGLLVSEEGDTQPCGDTHTEDMDTGAGAEPGLATAAVVPISLPMTLQGGGDVSGREGSASPAPPRASVGSRGSRGSRGRGGKGRGGSTGRQSQGGVKRSRSPTHEDPETANETLGPQATRARLSEPPTSQLVQHEPHPTGSDTESEDWATATTAAPQHDTAHTAQHAQQKPAARRGRGSARGAARAQSSTQSENTTASAPTVPLLGMVPVLDGTSGVGVGVAGLGGGAPVPVPAPAPAASRRGSGTAKSSVAISARGHTNRGRVKQKGAKRAELLSVGTLRVEHGWYNAGYIFPDGFTSRTIFRSSVELAAVCLHECRVVGQGGMYWPLPTFQVTAMDRPNEPLVAKSCTGCWSQVLKRINREIETRRAAGEDLPPAPKTAIAGPEYFGFNQPEVVEAVEALDTHRQCVEYWVGKEDRNAMIEGGQLLSSGAVAGGISGRGGRGGAGPGAGRGRGRGGRGGSSGHGVSSNGGMSGGGDDMSRDEGVEDATDECYVGNRWGAIDRAQRYRKRCAAENAEGGVGSGSGAGGAAGGSGAIQDNDHPLPGFLDPITLEEVVNPAISPYGHVMGMATWRAVLAEYKRCPFTKSPLTPEQLVLLTKTNIERYRDRIIQQ